MPIYGIRSIRVFQDPHDWEGWCSDEVSSQHTGGYGHAPKKMLKLTSQGSTFPAIPTPIAQSLLTLAQFVSMYIHFICDAVMLNLSQILNFMSIAIMFYCRTAKEWS